MSTKKFLAIGGHVWSKNDRQRHYVDAVTLCRLYRVPTSETILLEERDYRHGRPTALLGMTDTYLLSLRELRPDPTGEYKL